MNVAAILDALSAGELVVLRENLEEALAAFEEVRLDDTRLCGPIRILRAGDVLAVGEHPVNGELVLRPMADLASAEAFVRQRLETYERMWDGCGCRIDYYA